MALSKKTKTITIAGCLAFGVITGLGYWLGWWEKFFTWTW